MTAVISGVELYMRFAEAFNARDYAALDEVMVADFVDHHPGLVDVASLDVYKRNLKFVIDALEMVAHPEDVIESGDKVFTRIKLTGRHVGKFFGVEPTGAALEWYTNELWRFEGGKMVERWAVDDLVSLFAQMGVPMPTWE
jgi:predicted ester cyclase